VAGDQAEAIFAHAEAESQYRTALDLSEELSNDDAKREALERLGTVLWITARYDQALPLLEQAAALAQSAGDADAESRVVARIGRLHGYKVTPQEGVERLEEVRDRVSSGAVGSGPAALFAALAHLYFLTGRYQAALDSSLRAAELAREVGDDRVLVQAEGRRAVALIMLGKPRESAEVLKRVIPLAEKVGDLDTLGRALNNLGDHYFFGGDLQTAGPLYERGDAVTMRLGDPNHTAFTRAKLAMAAFYTGDWKRAEAVGEQAVEIARSSGSLWGAIVPLAISGEMQAAVGDFEEASRCLDEAYEIAERGHDLQYLSVATMVRAECDLLQDRPDDAIARLQPLLSRSDPPEYIARGFAALAEAYVMTGETDLAGPTVEQALSLAREQGNRFELVGIKRVHGLVLASQDQLDEAEEAFEESASLARSMGYPHGEARSLYECGLVAARQERPDQARERFDEALEIFTRLGARPYIEKVRTSIAKMP
jgi:tetratricopeptide (TPR) repeat protein